MRYAGTRVRMVALAVGALALVTGACNSGGDGSGSGDGGSGDQPAPTQAQADAALLTTADLPSGWQGQQSEDDGEEDDSTFCEEFDPGKEVDPAVEAEAEFAAAETGPFVMHGVAFYADEEEAEEAMDVLRKGLDECGEFTETDETLGEFTGSLEESSAPDLGDEAIGATITASGTGVEIAGDIVVVRQGRAMYMLMQLGFQVEGLGGSEVDDDLTGELATKAFAKLEAAG